MFRAGPRFDLLDLIQPLGGLCALGTSYSGESDEPRLTTQTVRLGDVGQIFSNVKKKSQTNTKASIHGTGVGLNTHDCQVPAIAEALERYCTCVFSPQQFIWATARELGNEALDLDTIPRCSKTELAHPRCPLVAPDKTEPLRWVRGLSLSDGREVYLPLVMVYLYTGHASRSERICIQITTGCAAHRTTEQALLGAILEVVERDAISLTWLQELPLPRITIDHLPPQFGAYWDAYQKSSKELEYVFFDATTDVGLPTVYGLQISHTNDNLTTLVSCCTALEPADALVKVMRDMAACRIAFRKPRLTPASWDNFTELFHGASFMARAEQAGAFDFLLKAGRERTLSSMAPLSKPTGASPLRFVLEKLRNKKLEVYAVDLSTDEALNSGMQVVRVIIPGLQPFSFHYRAQYKGHARLYDAPSEMGYMPRREEQLNQWPQPFA
jgi:ribosomal protein S12 methylthiotransferase accessory factor